MYGSVLSEARLGFRGTSVIQFRSASLSISNYIGEFDLLCAVNMINMSLPARSSYINHMISFFFEVNLSVGFTFVRTGRFHEAG
jgi:hypothetical protein